MKPEPYEVVTASPRHLRRLSADLRAASCMALDRFGVDHRRGLHHAFVQSFYCRTALMDDRPVAMWGAVGSLLDEGVFVWLAISNRLVTMPPLVLRAARSELRAIMERYGQLSTTILPDDEPSLQFAVALGFHDRDEDEDLGRRKTLAASIKADPRYKLPIGDGYAIGLTYHPGMH